MSDGYERTEPKTAAIAAAGAAVLLLLIAVVLGLQFYYDRVHEQQVYVKVLDPVSEDYRNLRAKEDGQLGSYQYIDRAAGAVRLPIARSMELLAREAAEDKLPYPTKPAPVVTPQQIEQAAQAAAAPGGAGAK
jgi:hypothetical protein